MEMELRSVGNPLNELVLAQSEQVLLRDFFMEEIWKPIPDCDGYFASNKGRVKNGKTEVIYTGHVNEKGYIMVSVIELGIRKYKNTARLVASAFHGKCDHKMVLHNNGNPADNRPENLRYGTAKDNYDDAVKHGTNSKGTIHGGAKLKPDDILKIREEYNSGKSSYNKLGEKYGVTKHTIYRVIKGDNWKWI